ncbi:MAG: flagellar motor switch protein FliG, partial [Rhodobacteraceae bacterium]|nr:flagellar motor switch protein FliG [Paracoccaceae bacterium]
MVVQILLAEGQALSLTKLPEEVQLDLTRELGSLRVIDKTTMEAVAREFLSDLEAVGLTAPGGIEAALNALRDRISPAAAARLRAEQTMGSNDPWAVIAAMESPEIVIIMEGESTEIAAVALSKIPVAKAAEVLGLLPGERARRIAFAVSQTGAVSPDSVARIGTALATAYGDKPLPAFTESPEARVGEILNSSPAATRDAVLEALGTDDPEFAEGVRKSIFTFANIPARVGPTDLPKVIRLVDGEVLVTALAAA